MLPEKLPARGPALPGPRPGRHDPGRTARRLRAGRRRPGPDVSPAQERAGPRAGARPAAVLERPVRGRTCRWSPRATSPRSIRRTWSSIASSTSPTAYRLSMWLHYLALAAATYFYARCLEILPWGAAMAAVAFTFCGFQAIHSSHEPFYCLMPYLPLALGIAERFMASGRPAWLVTVAPRPGPAMDPRPFPDPDLDRRTGRLDRALARGRRSTALEARRRADPRGRLGRRAGRRPARPELAVRRAGRADPARRSATCSSIRIPPRTGSSRPCPGWSASSAWAPRIPTGSASRPPGSRPRSTWGRSP